jgi:hypothetical protein
MHAENFFIEFLDILKNNFRPMGAYTPRSQSEFPIYTCIILKERKHYMHSKTLGIL